MDQHRNALRPGYQLHWYIIRDILGQGGFGITYLADDTNLNQPVAIKEYLPVELAVREDEVSVQPVSGQHGEQFQWGLDRFITEAQTLARFRHANIVRVLTVFKGNNTAYMVMEYEKGRPLHEILKERKTLGEEELRGIVLPILDGLEEVHAENFIHRDIKPANIYIRTDQSPVLLDFGSARQSLGEQTRTLTTMISPGYAPFEQYVSKSRKQGAWTDIYGLGATLYRAVTGVAPPDSMDRSEAILHTGKDIFVPAREIASERYTEMFLSAIDHAMAFRPEDRPQSIISWRQELSAAYPSLINARSHVDEDITQPVINPGRDANATRSRDSLREGAGTPVEEEPPQPGAAPAEEESIDRAYGVIKKLLKWLLVLFVILVAALVLSRRKSPESEPVEGTVAPPALEQAVPGPPAAGEAKPFNNVPVVQPGETTPATAREPAQVQQPEPAAATEPVAESVEHKTETLPETEVLAPEEYIPDTEVPAAAGPAPAEAVTSNSLVPESSRAELLSLKERLRQNPQDREARRELRELSRDFEENIRKAMDTGNYALARDYIREVQSVTSVNSRAWNRLNDLMRVVDEKESQAGL